MPNKKQRLRILKDTLVTREFETSLKAFNDEELKRFEYLSTVSPQEVTEQEWKEYEELETKRSEYLTNKAA